jgi:hypothetical protein
MRVLSARITRARRNRIANRVDAIVALMVVRNDHVVRAMVRVSSPARDSGGATLRARLLAAAKLAFASDPASCTNRRAA